MLSGKAKIAGVIGWPVEHSLSPRLHHYWLERMGIDGSYVPLAVRPEDLADTIKALSKMGFAGVNLTIPHKEAVIPLLDEIDETARIIGAVNTIIVTKEGKLKGTNTDAYGFMENIRQKAVISNKGKAVVLGAGGAAKAVVKALADEGFAQIVVVNRTLKKAQKIASLFTAAVSAAPWEERSSQLAGADLLVNTTSLGLNGKESLEIDLTALPAKAIVNDIVYVPLETELLQWAKARGNVTVDGLGMLIYQAVPAFEAWFGRKPQVTDELRRHLQGG